MALRNSYHPYRASIVFALIAVPASLVVVFGLFTAAYYIGLIPS